jgi:signal transduction histidine kinase
MTRSLKVKLILTYLAVALLTVLVVSALIRLTSGQSLMNLVVEEQTASLKTMAQEYYAANGSWDGFFEAYLQSARPQPGDALPPQPGDPAQRPPDGHPGGDGRPFRGVAGMVDAQNRAIFPSFGVQIGQTVPMDRIRQKVAVEVDGQTVAWILPDTSFQFRLSQEEQVFLQRTTLAIGLAALAGVLVALLVGFFFAARLLKPIRLLTEASQRMARGELSQQVPVTSKDELGLLTASFNHMSADLDRADQERKRMTSDITHDLSTPIQIISGYMEMLEEGEATLTPQRVEIIKTELEHLRRLVGDLSTLTQVEAGALEFQIEEVQPADLLERVYSAFQPIAERQGVALLLTIPVPLPLVRVDEGRMVQVLKNLLENALRHTPRGGTVQLGASSNGDVQLWVQDSGEGIDAEDLPYVFDRFYRADKARGGSSGKMGLGLAICKALVEAQNGTIIAESKEKGRGTKISIRLSPRKD